MAEKVDSGKTVSSNNNQLDRLTNLVEQVLKRQVETTTRLERLERVVQQTSDTQGTGGVGGQASGGGLPRSSSRLGLQPPSSSVVSSGTGVSSIGVNRHPAIRRATPPADSVHQQGPGSNQQIQEVDLGMGLEESHEGMFWQQSPSASSPAESGVPRFPDHLSPQNGGGVASPSSSTEHVSSHHSAERRANGGRSLTTGDVGYGPASSTLSRQPEQHRQPVLKPHVGLGGTHKSYYRKKRTGHSTGHGAPAGVPSGHLDLGGSMGMMNPPSGPSHFGDAMESSGDDASHHSHRSEGKASSAMERTLPLPPQPPTPTATPESGVLAAAPAAGKPKAKWGKLKTAVKLSAGMGPRASTGVHFPSSGVISDAGAAMTPMSPAPQGGSFGEGMLNSTGDIFEASSLFQRDSAAASMTRDSKKKGHGGGWSKLRKAALSAGSLPQGPSTDNVDQYDSLADPLLASASPHHKAPSSLHDQESEEDFALETTPRSSENGKRQAIGTQLHSIAEGGSIDVEGSFVSIMDVGFLLLGVFTIMGVVYDWHPLNKERMQHPAPWLVALVGVTEAWTAVWIVVRFFVRTRRGHWDVIDELPEIRAHYRKTWFLFDLSYTIPIEFIFLGWVNIVFHILIFRHFLRLVRAFSLGRSVNPLQPYRNSFRFLMFVCALLLVTHVAACVMWMLADSADAHDHSQHFIDALYWAVMTLTTTGFGDVPTNTTWERIWAIICMLLGIVTLSTFTAFATSFLTSKNAILAEQDEKKERMHAMLQHYQVPWAMQKDVMHCFRAVLNSQSEKIFGSLTEDLPEHLRDGLSVYFNIHLLRQVPFFAELGDDVHLRQLASRMHREFYGPAEFIFREGEDGLELYFVTSGAVEISRQVNEEEELVVATLQRGQCFGEGALLQEHNKRSGTAQAKQGVEVIVLSRDDFLEVLHNSPNFDPVMLQALLPQRRAEFVDQLREKKGFGDSPRSPRSPIVSKRSQQEDDGGGDAGRPLLARKTTDRFRVPSLPDSEGGPPGN